MGNAYSTFFGLITFLLEGDMESFKNLPVLGRLGPLAEPYQQIVFKRAQFLTELRGRGLFYLFVGSIAITQCLFCLLFVVGLWNVLMGALCLLMSFGVNPAHHLMAGMERKEMEAPVMREPNLQATLSKYAFLISQDACTRRPLVVRPT